jgi:hypothetical protein
MHKPTWFTNHDSKRWTDRRDDPAKLKLIDPEFEKTHSVNSKIGLTAFSHFLASPLFAHIHHSASASPAFPSAHFKEQAKGTFRFNKRLLLRTSPGQQRHPNIARNGLWK